MLFRGSMPSWPLSCRIRAPCDVVRRRRSVKFIDVPAPRRAARHDAAVDARSKHRAGRRTQRGTAGAVNTARWAHPTTKVGSHGDPALGVQGVLVRERSKTCRQQSFADAACARGAAALIARVSDGSANGAAKGYTGLPAEMFVPQLFVA